MKIAIPTESHDGERRVAASPDTVKAYVKKGLEVDVQAGAGAGSSISDDAFAAAGAKIVKRGGQGRRYRPDRPPALGKASEGDEERCHPHGRPRALWRQGRPRGHRQGRRHRLRHGADAAHHPRAGDGRAVVPGQPRRLQGRDRCRGPFRPRLPDDDDGGRHRAGRPRCSSWASASRACRRSPRRAASAPSSRPPTCARPPRSRSKSLGAKFVCRRGEDARRPPAAMPRKCRRSTRPSRPRWSPSTSRSRTSSSPRR